MSLLNYWDGTPATRNVMLSYIREHFGELLGEHVNLLDQPDGLEVLSQMLREGRLG